MLCKNCNNEIKESEKFCSRCGTPNDQYKEVVQEPKIEVPNIQAVESIQQPVVETAPTQEVRVEAPSSPVVEQQAPIQEQQVETPSSPVVEQQAPIQEQQVETPSTPAVESTPVVEPQTTQEPQVSQPNVTPTPTTPVQNVVSTPNVNSKNNNLVLYIVATVVLVVAAVCLTLVFTNKKEQPKTNNNPASSSSQNNNNDNNNSNNDNKPTNVSNTQKKETITIGYDTYELPSGFKVYQEDSFYTTITNGKVVIMIGICTDYDVDYTDIGELLKSDLGAGDNYGTTYTKDVGGRKYYLSNVSVKGATMLFYITKVSTNNLATIGFIVNQNNTIDTSALSYVSEILNSKSTSSFSNQTSNTKATDIHFNLDNIKFE